MKPFRYDRRLASLSLCLATALAIAYLPVVAFAACSETKVKRLSGQGKTVAAIARTCDMDADDIRAILKDDDSDSDPDPESPPPTRRRPGQGNASGLSSGTPLAPCGCWGPVAPGYREANPTCRSGFSMPRMCPQMCAAGGYAWQGVCG